MFKLHRRAAIFRGEYSSPLFQAFNEAWQLQEALYQVLAPYSVGAADVRLERREGEPSFTANVLALGMVVKVRLTHFEVFMMAPDDDDTARPALVRALLERLSGFTGGYRMFSLALDHHGMVDGVATHAFIGRYVNPPASESLGAPSGSSAVFYYGPTGSRLLTSIHLEPSSVVSGGLFVKTNCVWGGEGLTLDALFEDARLATRQTLDALGLS